MLPMCLCVHRLQAVGDKTQIRSALGQYVLRLDRVARTPLVLYKYAPHHKILLVVGCHRGSGRPAGLTNSRHAGEGRERKARRGKIPG